MDLIQALALPERGQLSIVGGGGKSALLLRLSRELSHAGRTVVGLTTTRITREQGQAIGPLLLDATVPQVCAALERSSAVCVAGPLPHGKLGPPDPALLRALPALAHWLLAEADGARGLPVKAPAGHEPALLPTGLVVAVAGLSALGHPLSQVCFRPRLAAALLHTGMDAPLTPRLLARLLTHPDGQYKGAASPRQFRILLNQTDAAPPESAGETAREILRLLPGCRVAAASLLNPHSIPEVYERCSL